MRTFVFRARKGKTRWDKLRSDVGGKNHLEVILHCIMNVFFVSSGFRDPVEVFVVLESTENFPQTIHLSSADGLSIPGFHEAAVLDVLEHALKNTTHLKKNETVRIAPGIQVLGYGFDKLMGHLIESRPIYLLDKKGEDVREITLAANPVFVLSDHLAMPKKSIKGLIRRGLKTLSLGKQMLFASQCVVLLHDALDRQKI